MSRRDGVRDALVAIVTGIFVVPPLLAVELLEKTVDTVDDLVEYVRGRAGGNS